MPASKVSLPALPLSDEEIRALDPDVVREALQRLENYSLQAVVTRIRLGWCIECNSNTHPHWCRHSRAAGKDLYHDCEVECEPGAVDPPIGRPLEEPKVCQNCYGDSRPESVCEVCLVGAKE